MVGMKIQMIDVGRFIIRKTRIVKKIVQRLMYMPEAVINFMQNK